MSTQPMSLVQFGQTIKAKHPEYGDISDADLATKVLAKYPQYKDMVTTAPPKPDNSIWTGVKEAASELNPITALTGLRDAVAHPVDTYKADTQARGKVLDNAKRDYQNGQYAGAAANALYSLVPFVGPAVANRGEQLRQGETAKGIGGSIGLGLNLAAPALIKNVNLPIPGKVANALKPAASNLYESALKPSTTMNPAIRESAVQAGLDQGITVSRDGLQKLADKIAETNQQMKDAVPVGTGKTVNKYSVASRLTPLAEDAANQVNPSGDLRAISKAGQEFINTQPINIPVEDAMKIKSGTYQSLGNKAYGELKGATQEAQKTLARGLKEETIAQFPELEGLGKLDQQLYRLEPVLERAVSRIKNHQLFGIGTPLAAAGAEAVTGDAKIAMAAAAAKAVFDQPAVKSRLAVMLQKAGSQKGVTLPLAKARVQAYINALGQSANQPTMQTADANAQ